MSCVVSQKGLTIQEQCKLLGIPRSSYYYEPKEESEMNQLIEQIIKDKHGNKPALGSPKMTEVLKVLGYKVNHKRIERLMKKNNLYSCLPGPKTTKRDPRHEIYPYALKNHIVTQVNEVWSTDITYLKLPQGTVYLAAIIDWYSRKVLAWRLSNTMDLHFCLEALEEAITKYGAPIVFNTDQGSQFTSKAFTDKLIENNILISMDGKGRAVDNIFIERFWWTVKYEELYLKGYETVLELKQGIHRFIKYYNSERLHQALGYNVPNLIYDSERKEYSYKKVA